MTFLFFTGIINNQKVILLLKTLRNFITPSLSIDKNSSSQKWVLTGLILLALFLRCFHISSASLWFDEILTAGRTSQPVSSIIRDLLCLPHPPLYYLIVKSFTTFLGINEFALRLPSMICSVLCVVTTFKLGKTLFDARTGLIAAFLVTVSAYSINYAHEAKMYSMTWLFAGLSYLYFFRWVTSQKSKDLIFYAVFTELLLGTSYQGFIFLAAQNCFFLFNRRSKRSDIWFMLQIVMISVWVPWLALVSLKFKSIEPNISWIQHWPYLDYFKFLFLNILDLKPWTGMDPVPLAQFPILKKIQMAAYVVLFSSSLIRMDNENNRKRFTLDLGPSNLLLLSWIIIPVGFYIWVDKVCHPVLHVFCIRYLAFIQIPIFLLIARSISRLRFIALYSSIGLIMIASVFFDLYPYYYDNLKVGGDDWRSVGQFLNKEVRKGSKVVFLYCPYPLFHNFHDGFALYYQGSRNIVGEYRLNDRSAKKGFYYLITYHQRTSSAEFWKHCELIKIYDFRRIYILKYRFS